MTEQILRVMPREMRLMSERILSLTALPKGFALMVGDVVMYSEAMGLGGFARLLQQLDALRGAEPKRMTLHEAKGELTLDCGGEHAWFAVPSLLDLLEEGLAGAETSSVTLTNLIDPEEIGIAAGLGRRAGMELVIAANRVTARRAEIADPVLNGAMADGCKIAADLWWQVWAMAQTALTPDSIVSRRHAGVNIISEDGQIIGRSDNDDDMDASFVAGPQASDGAKTATHSNEDQKQ